MHCEVGPEQWIDGSINYSVSQNGEQKPLPLDSITRNLREQQQQTWTVERPCSWGLLSVSLDRVSL